MGKGGSGTITANNTKIAEGRIEKTQPGIFSVDDLADIGLDEGTSVGDYSVPFKFNGKLKKLNIETKK